VSDLEVPACRPFGGRTPVLEQARETDDEMVMTNNRYIGSRFWRWRLTSGTRQVNVHYVSRGRIGR
jgi:hypothetical protein